MSDFGAIIIIKKVSGEMRPGDKNLIASHLVSIIDGGDYPKEIKTGNYKSLIEWGDEGALCSMLSEYYDDDEDDIREFAEEEDMDEAEDIAEKLRGRLGPGFSITVAFEDW